MSNIECRISKGVHAKGRVHGEMMHAGKRFEKFEKIEKRCEDYT